MWCSSATALLLLLIPQPPALQLSDWLNPMNMYDLMGKFIEIYDILCLISWSPNLYEGWRQSDIFFKSNSRCIFWNHFWSACYSSTISKEMESSSHHDNRPFHFARIFLHYSLRELLLPLVYMYFFFFLMMKDWPVIWKWKKSFEKKIACHYSILPLTTKVYFTID